MLSLHEITQNIPEKMRICGNVSFDELLVDFLLGKINIQILFGKLENLHQDDMYIYDDNLKSKYIMQIF